jgi:type VI secretion system protein ImpG
MKDSFLNYYNKELGFIRRLASEFAKKHPKVAGQLRMTEDAIEDPHVSRLMQSVAFLNAGIREKLDDDYPELTQALLNILYPHYLSPIPSMAIVQFDPELSLAESVVIKKGTLIETLPINGAPVRFQTAYETTLLPITIQNAKLYGHTHTAPAIQHKIHTPAVFQLSLKTFLPTQTFEALAPKKLRFFLKGTPQHVYTLYEMLMRESHTIAIARSSTDNNPVFLNRNQLKAVGFDRDEGLLPYSPRSHLGYRLITEFFTFPEKFLFLDIDDLTAEQFQGFENTLQIFFYLKQDNKDLEPHINRDNFALHCSPIVNLFPKTAEPINWDHTQTSYPIIPDPYREMAHEIYSIDRVTAIDDDGNAHNFLPFYGINHSHDVDNPERFWLARRFHSHYHEGERDEGTDMDLSLVDLSVKPSELKGWVVSVETTCLNRDIPNHLPFGGGEPHLQFTEGGAPVKEIKCLTAPTPTRRPSLGKNTEWRLLGHLSLNHLSFKDKEGAEVLREMLRLYDYIDSEETQILISGIHSLNVKRTLARDPSGHINAFCQGLEIQLEVDETKYSGTSLYLFASVLDRFFALYSSINSFTKLKVTGANKHKVLIEWQPRSGEHMVL